MLFMHTPWRAAILVLSPLLASAPPVPQDLDPFTDPPQPVKPTLKAGDPAPPIRVEEFLKGALITEFETGHVYVIEFFATWCAPCRADIAPLSSLQTKYGEAVTVCAINVWEDDPYTDATKAKVLDDLRAHEQRIKYTVAYDGPAKLTDAAYLGAARRTGIPTAVVIDQHAKIAWIGQPAVLPLVVDECLNGRWNAATGQERVDSAIRAYLDIGPAYASSLAAGDAAWEHASNQFPQLSESQEIFRYIALVDSAHYARAYALGRTIFERAAENDNIELITAILTAMQDAIEPPDVVDYTLALDCGLAIFESQDPHSPSTHASMSSVYHMVGNASAARAEAARSLELVPEAARQDFERYFNEVFARPVPKDVR